MDADIIVIGAGFAGSVAARELTQRGLDVVVLEGRDRVGGRAYSMDAWGRRVELGGHTLHWMQPHLWSEVTRYGFTLLDRSPAARSYLRLGSEILEKTGEELPVELGDAMQKLYGAAGEMFPRPFEPLSSQKVHELDHVSIGEALDELQLDPDLRAELESRLSVNFNAPCTEGALTQGMRRVGAMLGYPELAKEVTRWRLNEGSAELCQAIMADSKADVRLSHPVAKVDHDDAGASVHLRNGQVLTARGVIVTVPINVLDKIEFSPPLSDKKQAYAAEKLLPRGIMMWIRVKGKIEGGFYAFAPPDRPLVYARSDGEVEGGDTVVHAFGPEARRLDATSVDAVQEALRQWLPDVVVLDVKSHDWVGDEFSRGTWAMLKPNQLTSYLAEIQRPEGRVFLAGGDYANGWSGFFDGAIESGLSASRGSSAIGDLPIRADTNETERNTWLRSELSVRLSWMESRCPG